jgi:hypothetical protein
MAQAVQPISPGSLNDTDALALFNNIQRIVQLSDRLCATHSDAGGHEIYKLARDCRDLLVFDQVSRDLVHKLTEQDQHAGLKLDASTQALAQRGRKIDAIKELRARTGCNLREAKEAVEAYINKIDNLTW